MIYKQSQIYQMSELTGGILIIYFIKASYKTNLNDFDEIFNENEIFNEYLLFVCLFHKKSFINKLFTMITLQNRYQRCHVRTTKHRTKTISKLFKAT